MPNKTLADELITLIKSQANNNPAPEKCTIVKAYDDGYSDIRLTNNNEIIKYVQTIGDNTVGTEALICYVNGNYSTPIVIPDNTKQLNINRLLALGVGIFNINDDGDLIVTLPVNVSNFYSIDANGDLIADIPVEDQDNFAINENGDLIYTSDI